MNSRPPACKAGALPLSYSPGKKNTNLWNVGLISADRRAKPTLMLTIPRPKVKSSTKDLSLPTFEIAMEYDARPKPIVMRVTSGEVNIVAFQHGF